MSERMEKAISLDPAERWFTQIYGGYLIQARRFEEAEKQLKRSIEIDPNWRFTYRDLAKLYVELGRYDEALNMADNLCARPFEKLGSRPLFMAYIYARMGNCQKALEILNQSPDQDQFVLTEVYTALNDFDKAFELINRSLDRREGFMFGYPNFLALDKLKSDLRWNDVSRRINLLPKS
jgi:tetratricopeptide (TPR) repeat protein